MKAEPNEDGFKGDVELICYNKIRLIMHIEPTEVNTNICAVF